jgi:hypothetical protein
MTPKFQFLWRPFALACFLSCKTSQTTYPAAATAGMFKVPILYPNDDDKTFDMDYYENKHMPMLAGLLGRNLKYYEIDKGISGRMTGDKVPFLAIAR